MFTNRLQESVSLYPDGELTGSHTSLPKDCRGRLYPRTADRLLVRRSLAEGNLNRADPDDEQASSEGRYR